ncbi:hypothetical protein [Peribacillus kribbensis]|uniref:hypothetical protein n=1 Tax=Peribacillus kribbensis TaxID=356658 RepID=UPI000413C8DB|nr:hypothetical protein [Peribacillus kribbensis]
MSFVTPITDYQSMQYAARTESRISSSKEFVNGASAVFAVMLNRKREREEQEGNSNQYQPAGKPQENQSREQAKRTVPMEVLQIAAEITGKGKAVNFFA